MSSWSFDTKKFVEWLRRQGADVLAPTNPYELARFRARGAVHVIYINKSGNITSSGQFVQECLKAFDDNFNIPMGFTGRRKTLSGKMKASLFMRDGPLCFFCQKEMPENDMTIEHLVGVNKGGTSHNDNLTLAHFKCNQRADNLPLMEKIHIHRIAWAETFIGREIAMERL